MAAGGPESNPQADLDYRWIDRAPTASGGPSASQPPVSAGLLDPTNPGGLIWSQGWSRTRLGRRSARIVLLVLATALIGSIVDALWTQFQRRYYLVAYRAVIQRFENSSDQLRSVPVEVIDGFTQVSDARRFAARIAAGGGAGASSRTSGEPARPLAIVVSTRARLSPLCDRELVICQFNDGQDPALQGEPWSPSQLNLKAVASENLTDSDGRHR